jgi:hypothetical protein
MSKDSIVHNVIIACSITPSNGACLIKK